MTKEQEVDCIKVCEAIYLLRPEAWRSLTPAEVVRRIFANNLGDLRVQERSYSL